MEGMTLTGWDSANLNSITAQDNGPIIAVLPLYYPISYFISTNNIETTPFFHSVLC